jgi:CspA family cold shock protein
LAIRGVRGSRPANLYQIIDKETRGIFMSGDDFALKDTSMNTGTVKFYNGQKGFGFIEPSDGGKDVFVHVSALDRAGLGGLVEGQKLQFELEQDARGRSSAANLTVI